RVESVGLFDLGQQLGASLRRAGLQAKQFPTPHVTLLYDTTLVPLQPNRPDPLRGRSIRTHPQRSGFQPLQCPWALVIERLICPTVARSALPTKWSSPCPPPSMASRTATP